MNNNFSSFIAELRKEQGLTQKELADRVGVSDKAVSRWENGKNYPDIEIMQSLGEIFKVLSANFCREKDWKRKR